MERGLTHDPEFEKWANLVHAYSGDPAMDLKGYKKDLTLEVMNERGHVAKRYFLYRCWVRPCCSPPVARKKPGSLPAFWTDPPGKASILTGWCTSLPAPFTPVLPTKM